MSAPRSLQDWLDGYSADHQNPVNQVLHWCCVPPIVWSAIALLWTIPVPPSLLRPGAWAVLVMVLAFHWYWKRARVLALALLLAFAALGLLSNFLYTQYGARWLTEAAIGVFVLAWIGQFIGHLFEGRKPSFLTDLAYLLIGPAWLMAKLLRRLGFGNLA